MRVMDISYRLVEDLHFLDEEVLRVPEMPDGAVWTTVEALRVGFARLALETIESAARRDTLEWKGAAADMIDIFRERGVQAGQIPTDDLCSIVTVLGATLDDLTFGLRIGYSKFAELVKFVQDRSMQAEFFGALRCTYCDVWRRLCHRKPSTGNDCCTSWRRFWALRLDVASLRALGLTMEDLVKNRKFFDLACMQYLGYAGLVELGLKPTVMRLLPENGSGLNTVEYCRVHLRWTDRQLQTFMCRVN